MRSVSKLNTVLKIKRQLTNFEHSFSCLMSSQIQLNTADEQTPAQDEKMSIRAQRKRKARCHYQKKHKLSEPKTLDHELTNQSEYYFENGLRKVYPYYYNFTTYVKGRWHGRTILDVFTNEFKGETEDKYKEEIGNGRLTVNGKKVPLDFILGNNQLLEHTLHRHESPVLAMPIQIIEDTPEILVINKPPSIPCHPCGRYRYNTLPFILDKEYGYKHLRTLYRLDRLTSGVLIFPKTLQTSQRMERQQLGREFKKEYVCRVVGKFPDGEVVCDQSLGVLSHKVSICKVDPEGKESKTTFTRLSYNGKTSVVKCEPHTGRTHQIRVHLQYLGYPIVNDPIYNGKAFGPGKGKGGVFDKSFDEIEQQVMKEHNVGVWVIGDNPLYAARIAQGKTVKQTNVSDDIDNAAAAIDRDKAAPASDDIEITTNNRVKVDQVDHSEGAINASLLIESMSDGKPTEMEGKDTHTTTEKEKGNAVGEPANKKIKLAQSINDAGDNVNSDSDKLKTQGNLDVECGSQSNEEKTISGKCSEGSDVPAITIEGKPTHNTAYDESKVEIDELCQLCRHVYRDPKPSDLLLYLHALKYSGPGFEYSTEMPHWAKDDWMDEDEKNT